MTGEERHTRILLVDDDPAIVEFLSATLRFAGYEVRVATTGRAALDLTTSWSPDLLVLDVMLPDIDGFTVTRRLQLLDAPPPIVFLTARDDMQDKLTGLSIGGDDYITKPFSLEEVVARIRTVLRRTRPADDEHDDGVLRFADLELFEETHDVRRAGQRLALSPTEFTLLQYMMVNAGKVLSKTQILQNVWRNDFAGDPRIVESYISMLRRKVDRLGPPLIHTLRGVGYSLRTSDP